MLQIYFQSRFAEFDLLAMSFVHMFADKIKEKHK